MPVPPAFQFATIELRLDQLIPRKQLSPALKRSRKYQQIKASIRCIGLVQKLVVYPKPDNRYLILDGDVRAAILTELGVQTVECLIATTEEGYTYNKHVNALSTVQEHHMILKAIKNGRSEEHLATLLAVNVREIRQKRDLLNGIAPEAAELLKTRRVTGDTFRVLKRMSAYRQVQAAERMIATNNFSFGFAKDILAATKPEDLVQNGKKQSNGATAEQIAGMEEEMSTLQRDISTVKERYAQDMLTLSISIKYIHSLVGNKNVLQYLTKHHGDLLRELQDATQKISD
jgi:ParB-like chromosome segregation protein Spo0J